MANVVSPLGHLSVDLNAASTEQVEIIERPFLAQLSVRIPPSSAVVGRVAAALDAELPLRPNTVTRAGDVRALCLGPDEWLIIGPAGDQGRLEKVIRYAIERDFASVTDVSAQRTTLLLRGPRVRDLMAGGCALDLDADVFTDHECAQTMLAKAPVILYREVEAMAVAVRASFADYLARWLLDAAMEYRATIEEVRRPPTTLGGGGHVRD